MVENVREIRFSDFSIDAILARETISNPTEMTAETMTDPRLFDEIDLESQNENSQDSDSMHTTYTNNYYENEISLSSEDFTDISRTSTPFSNTTSATSSDGRSEEDNSDVVTAENETQQNEENNQRRPILSFNAMILRAIKESPGQRLTLSGIYQFLMERFPYFKKDQRGWQNSIRHNLSVSNLFTKVPRGFDDPGKGSYWILRPEANNVVIGESTGKLRKKNPGASPYRLAAYRQAALASLPYYPPSPYPNYFHGIAAPPAVIIDRYNRLVYNTMVPMNMNYTFPPNLYVMPMSQVNGQQANILNQIQLFHQYVTQ